jgi:hypothetical protein
MDTVKMHNRLKYGISFACVLVLMAGGCVLPQPPPLNPYPTVVIWRGPSEEALFTAVLNAIHAQGIPVNTAITNKEARLIVTNPLPNGDTRTGGTTEPYSYHYTILITKHGATTVQLNVSVPWNYQTHSLRSQHAIDTMEHQLNTRVSYELNTLARRISSTLGQPVAIKRSILRTDDRITLALTD